MNLPRPVLATNYGKIVNKLVETIQVVEDRQYSTLLLIFRCKMHVIEELIRRADCSDAMKNVEVLLMEHATPGIRFIKCETVKL